MNGRRAARFERMAMQTHPVLIVWPLDELSRVFPHDIPPPQAAARARRGWDLAAARGEYCGFQLGLQYAGDLADLQIALEPLRQGRNELAAAAQIRWTGLVAMPLDSFDAEAAERPELAPAWYPDPLQEHVPWRPRFGPHGPRQGCGPRATAAHLSLAVARNARAGLYRGQVTVRRRRRVLARVPIRLEVWPFALPRRPTFQLGNWLHLDCLTQWHRCAPWSERHWNILDRYAADMAAHRHTAIITPALVGNWHSADPMTLVDITRRRDGRFSFDLSRLRRWVDLFDRHGFQLFELFPFVAHGWGGGVPPFGLFDEKKARRVRHDNMLASAPFYRRLLSAFLAELARWLEQRRLTRRFLAHVFDEPGRRYWPDYARLSAFLRERLPGVRQIDAISRSGILTEFGAGLDIPVPLTRHFDHDRYFQQRALAGREPVWWYTCCEPGGRYANRLVCMPLLSGRILFWQAFRWNIGGFLHWGFNFWHRLNMQAGLRPGAYTYADAVVGNPYREHEGTWPVGDGSIVYPHLRWWEDRGPVSSLRWEAMRAGLQDLEILKMLAAAAGQRPRAGSPVRERARRQAQHLLAAVRGPIAGSLTEYDRDPRRLLDARRAAGRCLARLA